MDIEQNLQENIIKATGLYDKIRDDVQHNVKILEGAKIDISQFVQLIENNKRQQFSLIAQKTASIEQKLITITLDSGCSAD